LLTDVPGKDGAGLAPAVTEIVRVCFERRPAVVVVDSAKALRDFADERAVRRMFYELSGRVAHTDSVLLFLGEYRDEEMQGDPEFSLADGIVQMVYEPYEPVDRRWLRVMKLRGSHQLGASTPSRSTGLESASTRAWSRLGRHGHRSAAGGSPAVSPHWTR
jgi:circadian clock protein KaiC